MNGDVDDPRTDGHRIEKYRTRHDWSGPRELATSIVLAVAEVTGEDPLSLPVLRDVIDPDGLNQLFPDDHDGPTVDIRFDYAGFEIVVSSDGYIHVYDY